jgi:hypothetical protein
MPSATINSGVLVPCPGNLAQPQMSRIPFETNAFLSLQKRLYQPAPLGVMQGTLSWDWSGGTDQEPGGPAGENVIMRFYADDDWGDKLCEQLEDPPEGWETNKGYEIEDMLHATEPHTCINQNQKLSYLFALLPCDSCNQIQIVKQFIRQEQPILQLCFKCLAAFPD